MRSGVELRISGVLCDIAEGFDVRLNRQLLNPAELAGKDAQYSYSVTLPATAANNAALRHANVEEVRGKFSRSFPATLSVRGAPVFSGRFRLTEVTGEAYKGNLYLPKARTAKDVFGDRAVSDTAPWLLPFGEFAESVSRYNRAAATETQDAIFPYVLYGLLPKVADATGKYSPRDVWDDTVRLGVGDLPPSVNLLRTVHHLFEGAGYRIGGSAFDDERLARIYMSYRNPSDYLPAWNWGRLGRIAVRGRWSNVRDLVAADDVFRPDAGIYRNEGAVGEEYAWNLLDSTNAQLEVTEDPGKNVLRREHTDEAGRTWRSLQVRVPVAGFYKVTFEGGVRMLDDVPFNPLTPPWADGVMYCQASTEVVNGFTDGVGMPLVMELRLLRDRGEGDFRMDEAHTDGVMYRNNLDQSAVFGDADAAPKYFPQAGGVAQLVLIDRAEDDRHVVGLNWGTSRPTEEGRSPYRNPLDTVGVLAQVQAAKPALSWNSEFNADGPGLLAVQSPGYAKYYVSGTGADGNPVFAWESNSGKYRIELEGAPSDFSMRGMYGGTVTGNGEHDGQGAVHAVVWLEAGELLTVAAVSQQGECRIPHWVRTRGGCVAQEAYFRLEVEPYQTRREWLKVDAAGTGTAPMSWADASDFLSNAIDLARFLPTEVKANDFLDNVCKAFNLRLTQQSDDTFSLDVRPWLVRDFPRVLDLDALAAVRQRANTPLGLPARFEIGFTIDEAEEGYVRSGDDGGGTFDTGADEGGVVEQKSNFSYSWFKPIEKRGADGTATIRLPVISEAGVWSEYGDYAEDMAERFTDLAQRFWYYDGLLDDAGTPFDFGGDPLALARVSNVLPGRSVLDYKDAPRTIMRNYFSLLIDAASHYTTVEVYLPPALYARIGPATGARFNGDLYYIAGVEKYDPSGRERATLKLIRRI